MQGLKEARVSVTEHTALEDCMKHVQRRNIRGNKNKIQYTVSHQSVGFNVKKGNKMPSYTYLMLET